MTAKIKVEKEEEVEIRSNLVVIIGRPIQYLGVSGCPVVVLDDSISSSSVMQNDQNDIIEQVVKEINEKLATLETDVRLGETIPIPQFAYTLASIATSLSDDVCVVPVRRIYYHPLQELMLGRLAAVLASRFRQIFANLHSYEFLMGALTYEDTEVYIYGGGKLEKWNKGAKIPGFTEAGVLATLKLQVPPE